MVLHPAGKKPFNVIISVCGAKVPVDEMIIANNRAKNLGDLSPSEALRRNQPPRSHPTFDRLFSFATTYESQ